MTKTRNRRLVQGSTRPTWLMAVPLLVFGVLTVTGRSEAGEDESKIDEDKLIERIVSDWKKRSQSIDSLVLFAEGTAFYKKGIFDEDRPKGYAGHYPPEDTVFDVRLEAYCDYKRNRIRVMKSYPRGVLTSPPPMYFEPPTPRTYLHDGTKYFFWEEPQRNADGTSTHTVSIVRRDFVRLLIMGLEYDPIAFTTGNIPPNGVASSQPDRLRTTLSADRFRYLGTAFHDGRTVHRLGYYYWPKTHSELWVDVERDSVVVRSSFVVEEKDVAVFTFDYEHDGEGWMLAEWTGRMEPACPSIRFRVKKLAINESIDDDVFSRPNEPGTRVRDVRSKAIKYYRIDTTGQLVPDDRKQDQPQEQGPDRSSTAPGHSGSSLIVVKYSLLCIGFTVLAWMLVRHRLQARLHHLVRPSTLSPIGFALKGRSND